MIKSRLLYCACLWILALISLGACRSNDHGVSNNPSVDEAKPRQPPKHAEDMQLVDCLLPGKVRSLGALKTYMTPRRPARETRMNCQIRGGEYTAYDRSSLSSSLKIWLPMADAGDPEAQLMVGEIYEQGLVGTPDYALAAHWYKKSAEQNNNRAAVNLGYLYENGLGVEKDQSRSLYWMRRASGLKEDLITQSEADAQLASVVSNYQQELQTLRLEQETLAQELGWTSQQLDQSKRSLQQNKKQINVLRATASESEQSKKKLHRLESESTSQISLIQRLQESLLQKEAALTAAETALTNFQSSERAADAERHANKESEILAGVSPTGNYRSITHDIDFGRYYALVIGNNSYKSLPNLKTAEADARGVHRVLQQKYGYQSEILLNATQEQVLLALGKMQAKLTESDNLLIYYAGHGAIHNNEGNWLPIDSEFDSPTHWISASQLSALLATFDAKQILVVADSCYSGTLTRSAVVRVPHGKTDEIKLRWLKIMANARSRTVLTSGGLQPVLDSGGGDHSIFAKHFIEVLDSNDAVINGHQLYAKLFPKVKLAAEKLREEQAPMYAPIKFSGHASGDFFFIPKPEET